MSSVIAVSPGTDYRPECGADGGERPSAPRGMPIVSRVAVDDARQTLVCELLVPHDLRILHGHFPAVPIVPGVTQVGWVVELARQHGIAAGRCFGIVTAKFRRLVLPGMRLSARIEAGPGAGQCQFTFQLNGAAVSTGRLQFGPSHG